MILTVEALVRPDPERLIWDPGPLPLDLRNEFSPGDETPVADGANVAFAAYRDGIVRQSGRVTTQGFFFFKRQGSSRSSWPGLSLFASSFGQTKTEGSS